MESWKENRRMVVFLVVVMPAFSGWNMCIDESLGSSLELHMKYIMLNTSSFKGSNVPFANLTWILEYTFFSFEIGRAHV